MRDLGWIEKEEDELREIKETFAVFHLDYFVISLIWLAYMAFLRN